MTQTNDPPLISSIELIPDAAEKADLDAPNTSGGKLVIGQAPNITITETTVVADADERLALDVQEGDIAVQTNVSTSFIFTGGDNVANNWETLDFDAVGAIDGEDINPRDINPRDITASGDISLQNLTVAGAINGADASAAAAGEALTSDGNGGFSFASAGGDLVGLVTATPQSVGGFVSSSAAMSVIAPSQNAMEEVTALQTAMAEVIESQTAMQEVRQSPTADNLFHLSDLYAQSLDTFASIDTGLTGGIDDIAASQTAMQEVAASQTAMQEVAASQTAMQEVAASQTAMQEVINSQTAYEEIALSATARNEIENSPTAVNELNNAASSSTTESFNEIRSKTRIETIPDTNNSPVYTWIKNIEVDTTSFNDNFNADLTIRDDGATVKQELEEVISESDFFAKKLQFGTVNNGNSSGNTEKCEANVDFLQI